MSEDGLLDTSMQPFSISPLQQQQQQQQQQQRGFTWIQILQVFVLSRASDQNSQPASLSTLKIHHILFSCLLFVTSNTALIS